MNDVSVSDLVAIEPGSALQLFTTPAAIDPLLDRIRKEIDAFEPDISSDKGRKAVASMAYKVARAKTYLDDAGRKLADQQKEIPKKIDATRKLIRDTLDKWKDEVRAPLTAWEAAEDERVERIKSSLAEFQAVIDDQSERPAALIRERLGKVEREAITEQFYAEYVSAAAELKDKALAALRDALKRAEQREAEQAELARLRAAEAERKQKERDEQIAREAAEKAKRDAEAKAEAERKAADDAAKRERDAAEKRELELKLQAEAAERRALEAEAKAKREAEQERAAAARREADKAHRAKINKAALDAFVRGGIAKDTAKAVITLIAQREIPNVSIHY
jgi:hypothetical protein